MIRHDNFSKFKDLRKEFRFLSYDLYTYHFTGNSLEISYSFNLSSKYSFNPRISIPYRNNIFQPVDSLSPEVLDNLVFHMGMIELISYWKAACPAEVIVKPHILAASQVDFWKKIYFHGLGEFFFTNSIPAGEDDFMKITCHEDSQADTFRVNSTGGCLVPVGGGKDSAVTMGLLNKNAENWMPFVINPGNTTRNVINAAGKSDNQTIVIHREIHPRLLELNRKGFLNGHTPFSALLAFYSLMAAYLTGRTDIVLSNESSANEVTVPGTLINHQYSKSIGFEKDFREYTHTFLSKDFNYFSILRPLAEIQIARIFSEMPEFLPYFRSCNIGSKKGTWCGACPKCLFTFIILSPFLKPGILTGIFGKNLLEDAGLEDIFDQLTGKQEVKPFECIGTVDEVNLAMDMAVKMYGDNDMPYLVRLHRQRRGPRDESRGYSPALAGGHFLPVKYITLLENALR